MTKETQTHPKRQKTRLVPQPHPKRQRTRLVPQTHPISKRLRTRSVPQPHPKRQRTRSVPQSLPENQRTRPVPQPHPERQRTRPMPQSSTSLCVQRHHRDVSLNPIPLKNSSPHFFSGSNVYQRCLASCTVYNYTNFAT